MNFLDLPWEIILLILKTYNDYKYCIRLLITCKQLYENELLIKEIKNCFTKEFDEYGSKLWFFNGRLHREGDKPALIDSYGNQYWYFNGKYHRENNKPAIVESDKYQAWFLNDKRHRENGPARIWSDEGKEWFLNDKQYTEEQYWEEMEIINSLKN